MNVKSYIDFNIGPDNHYFKTILHLGEKSTRIIYLRIFVILEMKFFTLL